MKLVSDSVKKKLYLGGAVLVVLYIGYDYLCYEACRQKYPNTSAWVCWFNNK
jgi:hypothetical protein